MQLFSYQSKALVWLSDLFVLQLTGLKKFKNDSVISYDVLGGGNQEYRRDPWTRLH